MLHSFTSLGSRRERLLQRGGSCTCCRRWSDWSLHHTVRQKLHVSKGPEMPTTILVRECYFLSFDAAVFGDRENSQNPSELNLHNKHRDSIHQFGMPWNKKNMWLQIEGFYKLTPCSQPRHASTTTRHHQLTLSCLLSCEHPSKSWQSLRSITSIQWGQWSGTKKLETNQSTIASFIMVYRLLLLGFPWKAEQWVRPLSLKVACVRKTLH